MNYNFFEAFQRALNVMRKELNEAYLEWGLSVDNEAPDMAVKKAIYQTYKSIVDRLDSLV